MNPGIVICSRLDSARIPNKVLTKINGIPILVRLLKQLEPLKIPVVVAVPHEQFQKYKDTLEGHFDQRMVVLFGSGHALDPLARVAEVQEHFKFTHVVRITHDKIFVDTGSLSRSLAHLKLSDYKYDYVYSSKLTPGTGFEVLSAQCLKEATHRYKNVEHITYAARAVSAHSVDLDLGCDATTFNLLIDFPEDLQLMEVLINGVGDEGTLPDVLEYLRKNPKLAYINTPPLISVYTCVHNGEEYIERAMASVFNQRDFRSNMEYIIVDDASSDSTLEKVAKFAVNKANITWYRNQENKGLASSSNFAISRARGKYVLRLDADDFFTDPHALMRLAGQARISKNEITYPNNYFGSIDKIQKGNEQHHVGGALFNRSALNFVRFTEGLRAYDGLDLFVRAKDKLKIGYYDKPLFMYTQRAGSLSKIDVEEREKVRRQIEAQTL